MRTKRNNKAPSLKSATKSVKNHLEHQGVKKELVPSGCVLFNLACSGSTAGFMEFGTMANLVGDSDAGKTFLAMTILAACFYKYGDAYSYYYLDYERAVSFDIASLFGKAFAEALHYIAIPEGPRSTIEHWYKTCMSKLAGDKPCIIITDSFDGMSSLAQLKAFEKQDNAKEGEIKSGFGTDKARKASGYFPIVCQKLADTGSALVIISQTRENLNPFSFDKKTRSGGKALRFYSSMEIWLAKVMKLGVDKQRPIGGITKALVKRSRITGKVRQCEFPILYAYGVDDTRSNLMFLHQEGVVGMKAKVYKLDMFDNFTGKMRDCVAFIEQDPSRVKQLRKLTARTWKDIEERILNEALCGRKPKFAS